jgi:hypothetical protein
MHLGFEGPVAANIHLDLLGLGLGLLGELDPSLQFWRPWVCREIAMPPRSWWRLFVPLAKKGDI